MQERRSILGRRIEETQPLQSNIAFIENDLAISSLKVDIFI